MYVKAVILNTYILIEKFLLSHIDEKVDAERDP